MPEPVAAWTIADLADFEQLLASPSSVDEDRRLYETRVRPRVDAAALNDRRTVFRAWLQARRDEAALSAGASYELGRRSLRAGAVALGFFGGAALAGSLLAPGGGEPVNALMFLLWTVGLQALLLALAALGWALGRFGVDLAPLRAMVAGALSAATRSMRRLGASRRDALHAALAKLHQRGRLRGGLLKWPAIILMQQFAVAFNLGLLGAMLLVHLPFAELRFGWQSTYDIEPQHVHRAVTVIAAPWSGFAPGARPSLDEIRATRYAQGQGALTLASGAARSWWPFLVLAITCYGLLLRALLLAAAVGALRRQLRTIDFTDPDSNALWRRLRGSLVLTRGGTAVLPAGSGPAPREAPSPGEPCFVLLSEEMTLSDERLRNALQGRFGWQLAQAVPVRIDDRHAAAGVLPALRQGPRMPSAVVVVAPAGRDPIVAVANFLRAVAAAAAPIEVVVLLCGDTRGDAPSVDEERYAIWRRFIAIQQLDVGLERWS